MFTLTHHKSARTARGLCHNCQSRPADIHVRDAGQTRRYCAPCSRDLASGLLGMLRAFFPPPVEWAHADARGYIGAAQALIDSDRTRLRHEIMEATDAGKIARAIDAEGRAASALAKLQRVSSYLRRRQDEESAPRVERI
jgi:hypothetical protein